MRNGLSTGCLASIFALALLNGCSDDKGGSGANSPAPQPKPLPACEPYVKVSFVTNSKETIRQRTIRLGYRADSYFHTETFYDGNPRVIELQRLGMAADRPYHATVETQFHNGQILESRHKFYTPKCDEREEYQRLNPNYSEPIELVD